MEEQPTKKQLELMQMESKPDALDHVPDIIPRLLSERSTKDVLSDALNKIVYLYEIIAGSITEDEIYQMSAKDKLLALQKLSNLHEIVNKSSKGNKVRINQMNIFKAGREELEAAMLDIDRE